MGRKTPKIVPFPWDFVTLLEEDRDTAIGNMHRKIGKDRSRGSGDIMADRQTDTYTQTCSSQYFATAPAGEVMNDTQYGHVWSLLKLCRPILMLVYLDT